jgi:glycosyltransferase involved in cell wall biosynthesis
MKEYYDEKLKTDEVYLYLVGDGPEKVKYQKLVREYGLQKYVKFYPTTTGSALDELYDQADIALVAFGMYKVGYYSHIGAIKSRECLARGIPLISGSPIDVLKSDFKYARIFPNDSSAVDIAEVVTFYDSIRKTEKSKADMAEVIRGYAREHADMKVVMKPIEEYIGE